ncbi:hypothetical protein [Altericista sp. CCNU0014]|uniref:hypothetical protein n=1 Tax=Altericista sp. CCNU0014 TaxID=3082949 RepID=UPI00384DF710
MTNSNPVLTKAFLDTRFTRDDGIEKLAPTPFQVRLPVSTDSILRKLPNRSAFIRAAIAEKLQRDGLLHQGDAS